MIPHQNYLGLQKAIYSGVLRKSPRLLPIHMHPVSQAFSLLSNFLLIGHLWPYMNFFFY